MLGNGISTTRGGACGLCTFVTAEAGGNCADYPSCTAGCLRGIEDPNMQGLPLKNRKMTEHVVSQCAAREPRAERRQFLLTLTTTANVADDHQLWPSGAADVGGDVLLAESLRRNF